jgi:hypothetical protein
MTFSEPVCRQGGTADLDWNVQNISSPGGTDLAAAGTTDNLPTDCDDAVATFNVFLPLGTSVPNGAFVEATLNAVGVATAATDNEDIIDASGNEAAAPQSRQATATAPETTRPTFVSATGAVGQPVITLTFSEAVYCDAGQPVTADFNIDEQGTTTDPTVIAVGDTNACGTGRDSADTSFNIRLGSNLESDTSYVVTIGSGASGDIQDAVGNTLTVPASVTFTSGAGDFTPPTIVDARITSNLGTSDFGETNGDAFSLTFSEVMNGSTTGRIDVQDQDGTIASGGLVCGGNVTCTWNAADTTLTVTVQGAPIAVPGVGIAGSGTTPGLQIPFNVTAISFINDETGNPPNVLGSSDRLVDFE